MPQASSVTFLSWEGTAHPVRDRLMVQQTTRRVTLLGYYSCRRDKLSGEIIPTKLKYPSVPISLLTTSILLTLLRGHPHASAQRKLSSRVAGIYVLMPCSA